MKYITWKLMAAILTFGIGTIFATVWVTVETGIFAIPDLPLPNEVFIKNNELDSPETPDAAPKTMTFTESEALEGKKAALRDIKKGKLVILVRGSTFFQKLLEDDLAKYKIKVESIGCFFGKKDELFLGGYNEVSKAAINKRFGNGFIETVISSATQGEKGNFKNQ